MEKTVTGMPGLFLLKPRVFEDPRGYFFESYSQRRMVEMDLDREWVQDNQSRSSYGVVRGLHFQFGSFAQAKLLRVLEGVILDVVVDLRAGSPAFGKAYAVELSAQNKMQIYIPRGFAHGFSVLSPSAEVFYKCDNYYSKEHEGGIRFDDPDLEIDWKVPPASALVSEKDKVLPLLKDLPTQFTYHG